MPVLEDIEEDADELQGCCGQLLATNHECEHTLLMGWRKHVELEGYRLN